MSNLEDKLRYKKNIFIKELTEYCSKRQLCLNKSIKENIWNQLQEHPNLGIFNFGEAYELATK